MVTLLASLASPKTQESHLTGSTSSLVFLFCWTDGGICLPANTDNDAREGFNILQ